MTRRIFRAVCTAALAVFCITMLLILWVLYDYFSGVQQNQLRNETALAAQGVERLGEEYFAGLDGGDVRITWISADGTVLYDSASDSGAMENHLEREEIRTALAEGRGEAVRYSRTLMQRYLYCAQTLEDGTVLRMSVAQGSILMLLFGMTQPILLIMLVAAVLSFALASGLSRRIVEPMNRLDLNEPLENEGYPELTPLLRRIHNQQQQLALQEMTLQRKQTELDTIVGSMEEGMLLLDSGSNLITINRAARVLLDADRAGMGMNIRRVSDNRALQDAVQTASAGTPCTGKAQLRGRIIQISAAPVRTNRVVSGTAVVLFDITQQELAEQRRREFTANVSHELKTPLQSISGFSELLKCGMVEPEKVQPFSENIYNEAQRLITLVQDIINLSQMDEGGEGMQWARVNLGDAAAEVAEELTVAAGQAGVELKVECRGANQSTDGEEGTSGTDGREGTSESGKAASGEAAASAETGTVHAVPELVHDILYNLCENAIKYNHTGGRVLVTVGEKSISVKDTGIGIPEEHLDRIFERFYRVDKSHSRQVGGTGLGLSIVKHAAMILGAEVEVHSREGEGSEFRVTFR